jgi:23S rRNA pseudouridine1911/1915/1917 synthase
MPATETITVDAAAAGIRLDRLLAGLGSVGSREKARQALRSGKVSVDGTEVGPDDGGRVLAAGAEITIAWTRPGTGRRKTAGREALERAGVSILFEDDTLLVADKPSGLLTDAADADQAKHRDTLRKRVRGWLAGGDVWPAHRIDRDTTGVVAFAKNEAAWNHLRRQWATHSPDRVYLALVEGRVRGDHGKFRDWMAWDGGQRLQRPCAPEAHGAFLAEARWKVVERFGDTATLLEVALVTGRRNQIRLHAMLVGHPLVGEPLYRREDTRVRVPFARQALHARRLAFDHPRTGQRVVFEAPVPPDLAGLLKRLTAA